MHEMKNSLVSGAKCKRLFSMRNRLLIVATALGAWLAITQQHANAQSGLSGLGGMMGGYQGAQSADLANQMLRLQIQRKLKGGLLPTSCSACRSKTSC